MKEKKELGCKEGFIPRFFHYSAPWIQIADTHLPLSLFFFVFFSFSFFLFASFFLFFLGSTLKKNSKKKSYLKTWKHGMRGTLCPPLLLIFFLLSFIFFLLYFFNVFFIIIIIFFNVLLTSKLKNNKIIK